MIVSALSIHYLGHEEKPVLYGKMHEALNPGGIFVHANQVEGETREQHLIYELLGWVCGLEHLFHRLIVKEAMVRRDTLDRMGKFSVQREWLREAGFFYVLISFIKTGYLW